MQAREANNESAYQYYGVSTHIPRDTPGFGMLTFFSLSRPSLSSQAPLPAANTKISPKASLVYPSPSSDNQFILTPIVSRSQLFPV